jgi:hypothetical protein
MDAAENGMTQNGTRGEPGAGPTRTPGSAGGPEKPTGGNTGRALRSDPTKSGTTSPLPAAAQAFDPHIHLRGGNLLA